MRHASGNSLGQLDGFLAQLRTVSGLREPRRGVFYRRSKAFLHFHEDKMGLFADVRFDKEWERSPVNTEAERDVLFSQIRVRPTEGDVSSPAGAAAGSTRR